MTSFCDMSGLLTIVTGAGTGIGKMIATAYVKQGASVYLVGRREQVLEKAVKSIEGETNTKGKAHVLVGDISTREGIEKLVRDYESASKGQKLDVLVSNAGIYMKESIPWQAEFTPEQMSKHFLCSTVEEFTDTTKVNVAAAWHLSGAFLPHLAKADAGNIVLVSSINGVHWSALTCNPSYAASKVAVNHLTKIMANKLRNMYIRVNTIAPGFFPSEMNDEESMKKFTANGAVEKIPAKRIGNAEDMGSAAVFLALNCYCDGQILVLDGGRSLIAAGQ